MFSQDISIGAVGAGLIAAIVSFIGLIISKENKTSEFRQQWIDALRQDISDAISSIVAISIMGSVDFDISNASIIADNWRKAAKSLAAIELRLNLIEGDHLQLQGKIRQAEILIGRSVNGDDVGGDLDSLQEEVMDISHQILKREWERVKEGESTFQITKYALLVAILWAILRWAY